MSKVMLVAKLAKEIPVDSTMDYVGIESGAVLLNNLHIKMKYAIGDFDSISEKELEQLKKVTKIIQLPKEKNQSDTEYAIHYVYDQYDEVYVTGVSGGRLDHFIAVYHLLAFTSYNFTIIDEQNSIKKIGVGIHKIRKERKYLSLFACEESEISIDGVAYPLSKKQLNRNDVYTLSNEIKNREATINVIKGQLVIIQSND